MGLRTMTLLTPDLPLLTPLTLSTLLTLDLCHLFDSLLTP